MHILAGMSFSHAQLSCLLALIILSTTPASSILLSGASHKCEFSAMLKEIYFGALYNNLKRIKFSFCYFRFCLLVVSLQALQRMISKIKAHSELYL